MSEHAITGEETRRDFLKKAGIAAGATVWTVPTMQVIRMAGAGAQVYGSATDPTTPTIPCQPVTGAVDNYVRFFPGNSSFSSSLRGFDAGGVHVSIGFAARLRWDAGGTAIYILQISPARSGSTSYPVLDSSGYYRLGGDGQPVTPFSGLASPATGFGVFDTGVAATMEIEAWLESVTVDLCNPYVPAT